MLRIVFVCTGNTCRSSMAEALARRWLAINGLAGTDMHIESAGLAAFPGSSASDHAIKVLKEKNIDLRGHAARQFSPEMAAQADIILTMTENHKRSLVGAYPEAAGKIYTLAEYAGNPGLDISDPFGQNVDVYRKCAREIEVLVDRALHKISR